jgi:hypothetical protein
LNFLSSQEGAGGALRRGRHRHHQLRRQRLSKQIVEQFGFKPTSIMYVDSFSGVIDDPATTAKLSGAK